MPDVVLFPYLSLEKRVRAGPWEIIPKMDLKEADAVDGPTHTLAQQHLALYALPDVSLAKGCGCFARLASGRIGDPVDLSSLAPLRRSLLGAVLMVNPEEDAKNPGLKASTSENVTVYAHPLSKEERVSVRYGSMMRTTVGIFRIAEQPGCIPYPVELHLPVYTQIDTELADALYPLVTQNTDEGRRLSTTLDWLEVAWRNTESVNSGVRVMALKSGFEVLLDVEERLEDGRAALSALLDPPDAAKQIRTHKNRRGTADVTIHVTDLEWWFTKFTFLRNKIAHGNIVTDADWDYQGKNQVMLAQRLLLEAIRKKVADASGRKDLLIANPLKRAIERAWKEVLVEFPFIDGGPGHSEIH
jgi:hypothetical protein